MKLNKSTTILLNIMLLLVIVFLVKSLITDPNHVYANQESVYRVGVFDIVDFEKTLNEGVQAGFSLHSFGLDGGKIVAILMQ